MIEKVRAVMEAYPEVQACAVEASRFAREARLNRLIVVEEPGWERAQGEMWRGILGEPR